MPPTAPAPASAATPRAQAAGAGAAAARAPAPEPPRPRSGSFDAAELAAAIARARARVEWHLEHSELEAAEAALRDAIQAFPDESDLADVRRAVDEARQARKRAAAHQAELRRMADADTLSRVLTAETSNDLVLRDDLPLRLDRARAEVAQGRYAEGLQIVSDVLSKRPDSIEARVLKRHILHAIRDQASQPSSHRRLAAPWWRRAAVVAAAAAVVIVALGLWRGRGATSRGRTPEAIDRPASATADRIDRPESAPRTGAVPASTGEQANAAPTDPGRTPTDVDRRPPVTAAVPTGTLVLQLPPGVAVTLGERSIGVAPLAPIPVRQGTHKLVLGRQDLGEMSRQITIKAGTSLHIVESETTIREVHAATQLRLARRVLELAGRERARGGPERALGVAAEALAINPRYEPLRAFMNELSRQRSRKKTRRRS